MVGALVYLQLCSWANLVLSQLRRLRRPQYALGLLAGLAYFGFIFLRPFEPARPSPRGEPAAAQTPQPFSTLGPALPHLAAGGLFLAVALTWLLPSKRAALDFTEAEIAWLFPAPMPRRLLVHHRLLKAQAGLVFSALILVLVTSGMSSGRFQGAALLGWWILMSALELHRQAAGFTRTRLMDRGIPIWVRRLVVLGVLGGMGTLVWTGLAPRLEALTEGDSAGQERLLHLLGEVLGQGVVGVVLLPFEWLARPLVSLPSGGPLWMVLPALGMLGLLYYWALRTAVGFEDESLERAERRTRAVEAVRKGNWHLASENRTEGRSPFPLPPRGPRLLALTWKNLISAQSILASPVLIGLGLSLLFAVIAIRIMIPGAEFLKFFGALTAGMAPMLFFLGPELARFDLRQDLPQADVLKTFPLSGWQVVLGELLAPALALTLLQWLMIGLALAAFPEGSGRAALPFASKLSVAIAAAVLAPVFNLTLLLLHNGSALLFPAWVQLGPRGAQGFEAMGQRMLLMLLHLTGLLVALLVPAVIGVAVFLVGRWLVAWPIALPVAAVAAALVLGVEWALGLKLLGDRFERMDITE